eukprot:CFRG6587T1
MLNENMSEVYVKPYYLGCLAHASYLLCHNGSAFVIDPRRDVEEYLMDAKAQGCTIKGVFETHTHADFVSGHVELHRKTGATIYISAESEVEYGHVGLEDNQLVPLSNDYTLEALYTPGHTLDSMTFVLRCVTNNNKAIKAFTGDTLFIGDCGRPDLLASIGWSPVDLAAMLFKSLHERVLSLKDDVEVWPAHGAGSPCGKALSDDRSSTIGKERYTNPALQYKTLEGFTKYATTGHSTMPQYFAHTVTLNRTAEAESIDDIKKAVNFMTPGEVERAMLDEKRQSFVLDLRSAEEFAISHVPKSLCFWLGSPDGVEVLAEDGMFASWVGTMFSPNDDIIIVTSPGRASEALTRLARVGYHNVKGILKDGYESWRESGKAFDTFVQMDPTELQSFITSGGRVIDVRTKAEFSIRHYKEAFNLPTAELLHLEANVLSKNCRYVTYCESGFRSMIATTFLRRAGFDVVDVRGGFSAIVMTVSENDLVAEVLCARKERNLMEALVSENKVQHA